MKKPIKVTEKNVEALMKKFVRDFVVPKLQETAKRFPDQTPVEMYLGGAHSSDDPMWYKCCAGKNSKCSLPMTFYEQTMVPEYTKELFLMVEKIAPLIYRTYSVWSWSNMRFVEVIFEFGWYEYSPQMRQWTFTLVQPVSSKSFNGLFSANY